MIFLTLTLYLNIILLRVGILQAYVLNSIITKSDEAKPLIGTGDKFRRKVPLIYNNFKHVYAVHLISYTVADEVPRDISRTNPFASSHGGVRVGLTVRIFHREGFQYAISESKNYTVFMFAPNDSTRKGSKDWFRILLPSRSLPVLSSEVNVCCH